ncbi:hypothetical protein [Spirosoma lituiforme]
MVTPSDPFHQLLEHYLFSAAAKFIHLAKPDDQNQLIHLINRVNADVDSLPSAASPLWEKEREEPIPSESVPAHEHWLIAHVQRQIQRQEAYIRHLEKAIRVTKTCAQTIDYQVHTEPARSAMLSRNGHMLEFYQRHLAQMKSRQRVLSQQLSRLAAYVYTDSK